MNPVILSIKIFELPPEELAQIASAPDSLRGAIERSRPINSQVRLEGGSQAEEATASYSPIYQA